MQIVVFSAYGGEKMEPIKKVRKKTTSCEVRNRWNAKHYDRINVTLPKGYGSLFKAFCEDKGTTMNALMSDIIKFDIEKYQAKE